MLTINLLDDNDLSLLLKKGDERAFTEIYSRYWQKLYFIAHKLLKETNAAEEIVQDVFLILWKKREVLEIKALPQYLAAMTRYSVYRFLAKSKLVKEQENTLGKLNADGFSEIDIDNKILLEIISQLSNQLPAKCRLVFQYNKLQDKSLAEVAEQLKISQKTAEGHLTKALRIIRANFGDTLSDFFLLLLFFSFFR